jgi:hypothetical protein
VRPTGTKVGKGDRVKLGEKLWEKIMCKEQVKKKYKHEGGGIGTARMRMGSKDQMTESLSC